MSLKTLTLIKKLSINFSFKNFVIKPSTSHRTKKDRVAILEKTQRAAEIHATRETGSNFSVLPASRVSSESRAKYFSCSLIFFSPKLDNPQSNTNTLVSIFICDLSS